MRCVSLLLSLITLGVTAPAFAQVGAPAPAPALLSGTGTVSVATVPPDAALPDPAAPASAPTLARPKPRRMRFVLGTPTPDLRGFGLLGGGYGQRSMQMQFPVLLETTLADTRRWGRTYFVSDNLLSTDRNDGATRLAARFGLERPHTVGRATLTSEVRYTSNQSGTRQALSASVGTWLSLGPRLWGRRTGLGIDLLRFENRARRSEDRSPSHFARNAFIPSVKLRLPPLFFATSGGKGDVNRHPHLTLGADAWYFANEEAAKGYRPRRWEQFTSVGLVVPQKALGTRVPVVRALSFTYGRGANEANGYAPVSNFRANFILGSWEEIRPVGRAREQIRQVMETLKGSLMQAMTVVPDAPALPEPTLLQRIMNTDTSLSAP